LKEESRWSKAFYCYICASKIKPDGVGSISHPITLVCSSAMNDEKKSALFVKEGIKLLQKRSNPVELFVQKRVSA
jgi:hypothetical protein